MAKQKIITQDERSVAKKYLRTIGDGKIGRDIYHMVKSRYRILYVRTHEEIRVIDCFKNLSIADNYDLFTWDCSRGLRDGLSEEKVTTEDSEAHNSPLGVLSHIVDHANSDCEKINSKSGVNDGHIYVLLDFHQFLDSAPQIERKLKEFSQIVSVCVIVIVSPVFVCPPSLEKEFTLIDFPYPSKTEIETSLNKMVNEIPPEYVSATEFAKNSKEEITNSVKGLTLVEAENAFAKTLVKDKTFNIQTILEEKKQVIRKSGILEYRESKFTMDDIGGIDPLKDWLITRKLAFKEDAAQFGLPSPKGILLVGVPGGGKSMTCDALATVYNMPLLRLDFGAIFASHVGESVAPCEKVFIWDRKNQLSYYINIEDAYSKFDADKNDIHTLSWDSNGHLVLNRINKIIRHKSKHKNLIKIRIRGGKTITVTPDHSLHTINEAGGIEEISTSSLRVGDYIVVPHGVNCPSSDNKTIDLLSLMNKQDEENWVVTNLDVVLKDIPAKEYRFFIERYYQQKGSNRDVLSRYLKYCSETQTPISSDIILKPKFSRLKSHKLQRFLPIDSKLLFTAGLWMGDGCEGKLFRIAGHKDQAEYIQNNVLPHLQTYNTSEKGVDHQATQKVWNSLRKLLQLIGYDQERRIPEWILSCDNNLIRHFLRGYFYADGYITPGQIEASTVSKDLFDGICLLLDRFFIRYTISTCVNKAGNLAYRISVKERKSHNALLNIIKDNYSDTVKSERMLPLTDGVRKELSKITKLGYKKGINISRPNKKRKFISQRWVEQIIGLVHWNIQDFPVINKLIKSDLKWNDVLEITKEAPSEFVYDLSVDNNHNFYCSGFVAHNSEQNVRRCLQTAEAISPCILWIDEVEKGISGVASSGQTDGGTTSRVFGTLLTWMQDKSSPVFVICTANDVYGIPPEFMRAGRFDEIFFLDLPDDLQRIDITSKLISRKKRDPNNFNLSAIAKVSMNYTGAEIEKGIDNALFVAYSDNKRDLTTEDIVSELKKFPPLYNSRREEISRLRTWAIGEKGEGGRAIKANGTKRILEEKSDNPLNRAGTLDMSDLGE